MGVSRRDMLTGAIAVGAGAMAGHAAAAPRGDADGVERWGVYELELTGPARGNPVDDVTFAAIFACGDDSLTVPGFYDGDGVYRVRFSPPHIGVWQWRTRSNVEALDARTGSFRCIPPGPDNHGPVRVTPDGYHFAYADGTPFRQIGTTSYSWALQSDALCAETLATLARAPFNKIRMCLLPPVAEVAPVAKYPFVATGPGPRDWDPARPDPAYFRRFEQWIERLCALRIEADVILYTPYDQARGFADMRRADDERYLRYVAARFGAYRNVWWSMANEYDGVKSKTMADWDHLFITLQAADPHDRLRSIHQRNVYNDYRKPWITHASIQNGSAVLNDARAQPHRNFAQKAVIFDEAMYEGDSSKRWGQLTGEEMVERFWWGLIAGTYVGHSETYQRHSWLGEGGRMIGSSVARLAFLRRILESAPLPGIEPIETWYEFHLGGKPFDYYLRYFGDERPTEWPLILPGRAEDPKNTFRADIIDTWNMTITPVDGVFTMVQRDHYTHHDPRRPTIALPGKPWIAVRLTRV
jgi:hypothetical protein